MRLAQPGTARCNPPPPAPGPSLCVYNEVLIREYHIRKRERQRPTRRARRRPDTNKKKNKNKLSLTRMSPPVPAALLGAETLPPPRGPGARSVSVGGPSKPAFSNASRRRSRSEPTLLLETVTDHPFCLCLSPSRASTAPALPPTNFARVGHSRDHWVSTAIP